MTGRGGRAPRPLGLQTQHCEGPAPPALRLLFVYSEVFNTWSSPAGGCPLFYFLKPKQKEGSKKSGGRWWHAAVCLLCVPWWRGSHRAPAAPFSEQGSCTPSPVSWTPGTALRAGWEGRAMQGSWQHSAGAGGLSVPHCHARYSLCLHSQPGIQGWWQSSVVHQALPSPASCPL